MVKKIAIKEVVFFIIDEIIFKFYWFIQHLKVPVENIVSLPVVFIFHNLEI